MLPVASSVVAISPASTALSPDAAAFSPSPAASSPAMYSLGNVFTGASDRMFFGSDMGYSTPHGCQNNLDIVATSTLKEQALFLRDLQQKWQAAAQFFHESEKRLTETSWSEPAACKVGGAKDADIIEQPPAANGAKSNEYIPGVMLTKSAEASLTVDFDGTSECSTVDSPASLEQEPAYVPETSKVRSDPKFDFSDLPNLGSAGHYTGDCKPCAFFLKKGCDNGSKCVFCHLCDAGEKKRRLKEKKAQLKAATEAGEYMISI